MQYNNCNSQKYHPGGTVAVLVEDHFATMSYSLGRNFRSQWVQLDVVYSVKDIYKSSEMKEQLLSITLKFYKIFKY